MGETVQTLPRRLLGGELKRLRSKSGKSLDEVAKSIGRDRSRIVKVENGRSNLQPAELEQLLDFLGATRTERKKILALGIEARKRQAKRVYVDLVPGAYRRIADLESLSRRISCYEKGIFPGLLQSPEYVDALMSAGEGIWWEDSEEERANRVSFRLERQRLVFQAEPRKELEFIFTEDALVVEVGDTKIMRRQLEHILRVMDHHANATVRIIPLTARNSPAQHGGLTVLHFDEPTPPVGFVSVVYGPSPYLDERSDTDRLMRGFDRVRQLALSPEASRKLIEKALKEN